MFHALLGDNVSRSEVAAGQSDVTEGQTSHQAAVAHELTIPQLVDIESRTVEWVEPIRDVQVRQDPEVGPPLARRCIPLAVS